MSDLPKLIAEDFNPTRDYLQNVALAIGSLQRAFVPQHPRDWQYGLEVNMRGISTQPFDIAGIETRGLIDLVKHKVRLGETHWKLEEYAGPEILKNIRVWLESNNTRVELEEPEFLKASEYNFDQAESYAEALWWMDKQFRIIKDEIKSGVTSPILLYPHHFDLSLVWFPQDDDKQFGLGWSTGDGTIAEPYVYFTAYPDLDGFTDIDLPDGAYWQKHGFTGAILPYSVLQSSAEPDILLQKFAGNLFKAGKKLLG